VNSVGRYPCIISGFAVFPVFTFLFSFLRILIRMSRTGWPGRSLVS
jgi:hypothetical protein